MGDNRQPPLTGKASQETFISLLQLEPMPIADAPALRPQVQTEKDLPALPTDRDTAAEDPPSSGTSGVGLRRDTTTTGAGIGATATTSSLGLSNSGHSAVYYLSRVQRYSSYTFAIFTSVHLVTTSLVPIAVRSVPASESYLLLAREIYQTRVSEPLLVALPIVAHVAAGVGLRLVRRSQNLRRYGGATPGLWPALHAKRSTDLEGSVTETGKQPGPGTPSGAWWPWLHPRRWWDECRWLGSRLVTGWPPISTTSASGYALFAAVAGHVAVNRILPLAVEGDSSDIGLAYISHGFARHPGTAWASYTVLLGVAAGHMVWGWAKWLNIAHKASWGCRTALGVEVDTWRQTGHAAADKVIRKKRRRTWLAIQGCALLIFASWAAGGLGVVGRGGKTQGWVGRVYDGLFEKLWL